MVSRAPGAKDCADCGLEGCGLEFVAAWPFRDLGPLRGLLSWVDSESARESVQSEHFGRSGDSF
eukprot:6119272-Alexandrium_andersonii.AAC.1